ncbi:MAG TPA: [Fe-S]-binding protein, partial [Terracidiphilus sp.]|nr:[Fe-S]-binding protein [Terracidiphilus sp.]
MTFMLPTLAEAQHFSLAEKLLFAALAFTSAYAFWHRFSVVLRKILQSKKDPGFHLFPLAPRIRDFVLEVLLQAKVIRQRPAAGLAHAFVFWAFCAF